MPVQSGRQSDDNASWTREYQEIEPFHPVSSPFATTTTTHQGQPPYKRDEAGGFHDQEQPLLPNREPSPCPASPATSASTPALSFGVSGYRGKAGLGQGPEPPVPSLSQSTSHPARLSPPTPHFSPSAATSSSTSSYQHSNTVTMSTPNHETQGRPSLTKSPSSPLNPGSSSLPSTPGLPPPNTPFARPGSRGSLTGMSSNPSPHGQFQQGQSGFSRMAGEELRARAGPYPNGLTSGLPATPGSRGSMILYRRADSFTSPPLSQGPMAPEEGNRMSFLASDPNPHFLPPPPIGGGLGGSNRGSMYSVSGDSIVSMGMGDSKYPPSLFAPGTPGTPGTPLPGSNIKTTGSGPRGPFMGAAAGYPSGFTDGRGSLFGDNRTSVAFSLNGMGAGGLVAYAYDPDEDDLSDDDDDDWLHDPEVAYPKVKSGLFGGSSAPPPPPPKGAAGIQHSNSVSGSSTGGYSDAVLKGKATAGVASARTSAESSSQGAAAGGTGLKDKRGLRIPHPSKVPPHYRGTASWSWRGVVNITTIIALIAALLALFMVYPAIRDQMDSGVNARITGNTRINATGQAVEGDEPVGGGGGVKSNTRTTTRSLNPGGVTFNRRAVLFDLPPATATVSPSAVILRFMRPSQVANASPLPWPSSAAAASPVRVVEMPYATGSHVKEEEVEGDDEWVVVERPPKYQGLKATPTPMNRAGSESPEATLWKVGEGEEVLSCQGEVCQNEVDDRW